MWHITDVDRREQIERYGLLSGPEGWLYFFSRREDAELFGVDNGLSLLIQVDVSRLDLVPDDEYPHGISYKTRQDASVIGAYELLW